MHSLCLILRSAQMITTAIAVSSDGATIMSAGATYGILLAILFAHGLVCSAATNVLARLNLFYVMVNGKYRFTSVYVNSQIPCPPQLVRQ
jgi:hypothetical protein